MCVCELFSAIKWYDVGIHMQSYSHLQPCIYLSETSFQKIKNKLWGTHVILHCLVLSPGGVALLPNNNFEFRVQEVYKMQLVTLCSSLSQQGTEIC